MSLRDDAAAQLTAWTPYDGDQARLRHLFLEHLACHPDAMTRDCQPDHLTASAIVVTSDRRRVLLNLHDRYKRWMQFGGHCEAGDKTVAAAALRETAEESGVAGLWLVGGIAQLSRHEVRCGPVRPAHHLDVRFVAVAPDDTAAEASDESLAVRWFDTSINGSDPLPADLEPDVRELIALAVCRSDG